MDGTTMLGWLLAAGAALIVLHAVRRAMLRDRRRQRRRARRARHLAHQNFWDQMFVRRRIKRLTVDDRAD